MESTMKKQPAVSVPEIPGIDLSYRPRTYFGPLPLDTHLLSRVTGHQRREILRKQLETGNSNYPPELEQSTLSESFRAALGRIHPMFMGGEYLAPLLKNETEIARISLASTTADQISVRARRLKGCIAYRIVDEYSEDGPNYACRPRTSRRPLTLRELVEMIDSASEDGGAAFGPLVFNVNASCGDPFEYEDFVTVTSEFYPELHDYYVARVAAYFDSFRELEDEEPASEQDGTLPASTSPESCAHASAVARAMKANPGLTEEEARALAKDSGF